MSLRIIQIIKRSQLRVFTCVLSLVLITICLQKYQPLFIHSIQNTNPLGPVIHEKPDQRNATSRVDQCVKVENFRFYDVPPYHKQAQSSGPKQPGLNILNCFKKVTGAPRWVKTGIFTHWCRPYKRT